MTREHFGTFVLWGLAFYGFVAMIGTAMLAGVVFAGATLGVAARGGDAAPPGAYATPTDAPYPDFERSANKEQMAKQLDVLGDGIGSTEGLLGLKGSGMGGGGSAYGSGLGIASLGGYAEEEPMEPPRTTSSSSSVRAAEKKTPAGPGGAKAGQDGAGGGERVRQWFPEAFLWRPLVETDASGTATVPVRVPDQLTTWRVLGLAHTRTGAFAGDIATFDSRMDVYVDPVVPAFLYAGDQIALPIQVVNTSDKALSAGVSVTSDGALTGSGGSTLALPAGGSAVQRVALTASGAGPSHVTAVLSGSDAAVREIPVIPRGRPATRSRGGTVGSTVSFTLGAPEGADPTTEELEVRVFPGPLAVLEAEIERGTGSSQPWEAAYGFALAQHLETLAARTGIEVDADTSRRVRLLAWQRVVRFARSPSDAEAADLLAAIQGTTGHDQAIELASRLERTVIYGQRGDGTWSRTGSGNINVVLVQTAFAARTLSADSTGPRTRAQGALHRNLAHVNDAYTAAVVLASGLTNDEDTAALRKIVTDAVVDAEDGKKTVQVPPGAINPWGWAPSRPEMLAWTLLALPDDSPLRPDLVGELMSSYSASWGFGAGPADVIALEAVSDALPGLTQPVDVVLAVDGREVARKKLDPTQPKAPALLQARGAVGQIEVTVSPAVPGLAYSATLRSWTPWTGDERAPGVDVEVSSSRMVVGQDATISYVLAAPSGTSLTLEQGLAAGASVDELALSALSDRVTSFDVKTDRVRLVTRDFAPGEIMNVPLVVRPAFAGQLSTAPLLVSTDGDIAHATALAPLAWTVTE